MAIEQTTINMNGKWELAVPLTMNKLKTETEAYHADTTMALAKNEQKKTDLRCPFYFYNAEGTQTAQITAGTQDCQAYMDAMAQIAADDDLIKFLTGEETEGECTRDETESVWTVTFSCEKADDPFQMVFHKDTLIIQNYSNETTKTTLETYLATRPDLAQAA